MDATEHGPEGDLTDLERRLAGWQPASLGRDRDRMLFEAGRAAARAEVWARVPLASAAALALVAVSLGALLVRERDQRHALEVRIVQQSSLPKPIAPPIEAALSPIVDRPPAPDSYLVLTHHMLAAGLDDAPLPTPRTTPGDTPPGAEPPLRVRGPGGLLNF
jgi:hypothetical protein